MIIYKCTVCSKDEPCILIIPGGATVPPDKCPYCDSKYADWLEMGFI